jgi:hypothetical protein
MQDEETELELPFTEEELQVGGNTCQSIRQSTGFLQ